MKRESCCVAACERIEWDITESNLLPAAEASKSVFCRKDREHFTYQPAGIRQAVQHGVKQPSVGLYPHVPL
jgi:hypothetical protein